MRSKKYDIVTIGDCTLDHYIVPTKFSVVHAKEGKLLGLRYGGKIPASEFQLFPGGNPLNTAIGFTRLGLKAGIMTDISDMPESEMILRKIMAEGIDLGLVRVDKNAEPHKSIILVTEGERTVISHHCEHEYHFRQNFSSKWIYLTSLGDDFRTIYNGVVKHKKGKNTKIAYNPGSRQLMNALPAIKNMIGHTELLFVNMREAQVVAGRTMPAKDLLADIRKIGAKVVALTDGRRGSFSSDGKNNYKIAAFPGRRVDATGAGDAFASGFTAAIARGEDLPEAMRWGSVNAASEVGLIGVQNGLLTLKSMRTLLGKHKSYRARKF